MKRHEIIARTVRKILIETEQKKIIEVYVVKTQQGHYNYYVQRQKSGRYENIRVSEIMRRAFCGHIEDLQVKIQC